MKYRFYLGIYFMLMILPSSGNLKGEISASSLDSLRENDSYFLMNLVTPLDPFNPRWRFGYLQNLNEDWKIGLNFGYGSRGLSLYEFGNIRGSHYQLIEIRPEIYWIINPQRKTKRYLSGELFYISHKDVFKNGHYFRIKGESISYEQVDFQRQKFGLNLKFGAIIYSKSRFRVNIYGGLGVRVRYNTFTNVINPSAVDLGPEYGDMLGMEDFRNVIGTVVGVNPCLGINLHYTL